jgi:hypothetical protein
MLPDDSKIIVEVFKTSRYHYKVSARYESEYDPFVFYCEGKAYAGEGFLLRHFGYGTPFETQLKQATCDAVRRLKEDFIKRSGALLPPDEKLTTVAQEYVLGCKTS